MISIHYFKLKEDTKRYWPVHLELKTCYYFVYIAMTLQCLSLFFCISALLQSNGQWFLTYLVYINSLQIDVSIYTFCRFVYFYFICCHLFVTTDSDCSHWKCAKYFLRLSVGVHQQSQNTRMGLLIYKCNFRPR